MVLTSPRSILLSQMNAKNSKGNSGKRLLNELTSKHSKYQLKNDINFEFYKILSVSTTFALLLLSNFMGFKLIFFLYNERDRFNDLFYNLQATLQDTFFVSNVNNVNYVYQVTTGFDYAYFKFLLIFGNDKAASAKVMILLFVILFLLIQKISKSFSFSFFLLSSYPLIFCFFRGHQTMLMAILFSIFYLLVKKARYIEASLVLAIMVAHAFPLFIYGSLFLFKKKIKYFVLTIVLAFLAYIPPFLIMGNSFENNLKILNQVNSGYLSDYVVNDSGSKFNNSIYGLIKTIYYIFQNERYISKEQLIISNTAILESYTWVVIVLLLIFYTVFVLRSQNFLIYFPNNEYLEELLFGLTLLLILLPHISSDYKLVLLLIPIASLYAKDSQLLTRRIFLLIILLLLPKHFIELSFNFSDAKVTIQNIVNPIIEFALFVATLKFLSTKNLAILKKQS